MLHLLQMGPIKVLNTLLLHVQCSRKTFTPGAVLFATSLLILEHVTSSYSFSSLYTLTLQPGPHGLPAANAVLVHHAGHGFPP